MDYVSLFTKLLELSPFVAALFFFLLTVWKSMIKKDEMLMATMKEHTTASLQMQEKTIMSQNNSADANRVLAGSIDKMHETYSDGQTALMAEIRLLKQPGRVNGSRRPGIIAESKPGAAA